jgi:hypothetical protein
MYERNVRLFSRKRGFVSKTAMKNAELHARLVELMRAGSPVDLSVATKQVERQKVEIEQRGGIYDSAVFELEDGRVGLRADIAVTNQTARTLDVVDIELLAAGWDSRWDWLRPQRINFQGRANRDCVQAMYIFPGKCGLQLECDQVINDTLLERRRLPSKRPLEGWLLAIGGRMPATLRHGQWLDMSLVITGSDHAEYAETLRLWTERLDPRPRALRPPMNLFAQAEKNTSTCR